MTKNQLHPCTHKLQFRPDLYALAAGNPEYYPALLNSHSCDDGIGRYSILFAAPSQTYMAYSQSDFNTLLEAIDQPCFEVSDELPFYYGWFVYFSYECNQFFEPSLGHRLLGDEPVAVAIFCEGSIVIDHYSGHAYVLSNGPEKLEEILHHMQTQCGSYKIETHLSGQWILPDNKRFIEQVECAKDYIMAGDIYQANLSRQWQLQLNKPLQPIQLYYRLSRMNPAPFAGLMQVDGYSIISSSPERLVRLQNGWLETRPIAGTRPRNDDKEIDMQLIKELIAHPKERAEHIMLIDLQRNDLGRVCQVGTVEVSELMVIESYQRVHHIVSNVRGKLTKGITLKNILASLFPGGTITGCPKVRCMEIIWELESRCRGAYTGSFGYVNYNGNMDFNILIRTMSLRNEKNITMSAGAGIVHDSIAANELTETKYKIQGLLDAL